METPKPTFITKKSIKETIRDDLKEYFKKILINIWMREHIMKKN